LFVERAHNEVAKAEPMLRQLRCYSRETPGRSAVETYVAAAFRKQYDAHIDHFLPLLLTLEANGEIEAAVGIRFAESEPLFVTHYFDDPVLDVLAQRGFANSAVAIRTGGSQLLFILLAELLHTLGRDTGIFTVTAQVTQLLVKLGCELTTLCAADGRRLGAQLAQWGRYYDTAPTVVAGDVATTIALLRTRPTLARTFEHYARDLERIAAALQHAKTSLPLTAFA
jgi:hypothetical protein